MTKQFTILLFTILIQSCAMTDHNSNRSYHSTTIQQKSNGKTIAIKVRTLASKIVGRVKNGFGAEMAQITINQSKSNLIQQAITTEFKRTGWTIDKNSPNKLLIIINQLETEFAQDGGGAGYYAICDLNLYLKYNNQLYERRLHGQDQQFSYLTVTANDAITSIYNATQQCSKQVVKVVGIKVK